MSRPNPPIQYVCGFLFDPELIRVALIVKNRGPAGMAGKLNGIGGKMEAQDCMSPRKAMSREFLEETGVFIDPKQWFGFHTERYYADSGSTVHFMAAESPAINAVESKETERVVVVDCRDYGYNPPGTFHRSLGDSVDIITNKPMYNLAYLIPMARVWLSQPGDRFFEG